MIVRCIHNTGEFVPEHVAHGLPLQIKFGVTIGCDYVVVGMSIFSERLTVLINLDDDSPYWAPISLFEVVDPRLPADWKFALHDPQASCGGQQPFASWVAMWGYDELVADVKHSNRVTVDVVKEDMAIFRAQLALRAAEFPPIEEAESAKFRSKLISHTNLIGMPRVKIDEQNRQLVIEMNEHPSVRTEEIGTDDIVCTLDVDAQGIPLGVETIGLRSYASVSVVIPMPINEGTFPNITRDLDDSTCIRLRAGDAVAQVSATGQIWVAADNSVIRFEIEYGDPA